MILERLALCYNISGDLLTMQKIGVDIRNRNEFSSIISFLNVSSISIELFGSRSPGWCKLCELLTGLGIPFIPQHLFHTAGNDAYFTLRGLLMLLVLATRNRDLTPAQILMFSSLNGTAQAPLDVLSKCTPDTARRREMELKKKAEN
jgi:hypothetical protein